MSEIKLTPEQTQELRKMVSESVNSLVRQDAEKTLRTEISARAKDELGIPKKYFNALCQRAYRDDARRFNDEVTEILDLAELIGVYTHEE